MQEKVRLRRMDKMVLSEINAALVLILLNFTFSALNLENECQEEAKAKLDHM